jgi:hypothetical protein
MVRQFLNDIECGEGTLPTRDTPITAFTSTTYSITSTSSQVVAANSARRYLRIQNIGNSPVYISCTTGTVALNRGIRLGSSATDPFEIDNTKRYTGKVVGIAASSPTRVTVIQG